MTKFVTDLKNSFWFAPTLIVLICIGLAVGAVELDGVVGDEALSRFPRLFGAGAEGARELLSTIAGSTITVAGVVFSITIVALSLTAAQYSPRVLRNFMADASNQVVLGVFVGVYVYCLLVLRTVRGGDDGFVPGISIVGALLLAIVGVGFLIYFIHHIALSIQVSHIAARVADDTIAAFRSVYPRGPVNEGRPERPKVDIQYWHCVTAPGSGYIQRLDMNALLACARANARVLRMKKAVGEFVIRGSPLIEVSGSEQADGEIVDCLRAAYAINTYRDIHQDPDFGVQQLVDIALRALSPGVNDIGTARNVLDHITAVLCEVARHSADAEQYLYENGDLRVIRCSRSFEDIVQTALAPIRRNAHDKPDMLLHLLAALGELAGAGRTRQHRAVVAKHVHGVAEAAGLRGFAREDTEALARAIERVLERCDGGLPR